MEEQGKGDGESEGEAEGQREGERERRAETEGERGGREGRERWGQKTTQTSDDSFFVRVDGAWSPRPLPRDRPFNPRRSLEAPEPEKGP